MFALTVDIIYSTNNFSDQIKHLVFKNQMRKHRSESLHFLLTFVSYHNIILSYTGAGLGAEDVDESTAIRQLI